jgi:phosphopantothenoylcysteine decarboxylase/phosphopantothenate--cysteine ligase
VHKRIVVGVTGGIAAYKSADLVRRLREDHAGVKVIMTRSAQAFLGPLTLQALSGHPVYTELFSEGRDAGMQHIELARWCDLILVAPASANFMAKLAHGIADDLLSTVCLASTRPILVAPAMNREMWLATATQENKKILEQRGVRFLGPAEGDQACGEVGPGRLVDTDDLFAGITAALAPGVLSGLKVLVTADPTREYIDPVRYLSNPGKMGYTIAQAAAEAGASVTLVSGPVALAPPGASNPCWCRAR